MKALLTTGLGLILGASSFTAAMAQSKSLPVAPDGCVRDIVTFGYCSSFDAPLFRGPIDVNFFAVIPADQFADMDAIIGRYTSFEKWPDFVLASGSDAVVFNQSATLASLPATEDSPEILRHYADYRIASPIGYQDVRVLTHNFMVAPYEGALASLEFTVQNSGPQDVPTDAPALNGSEGVKEQTGSVHIVDCADSDLCTDDQLLLIYESRILPEIDLLPRVAAESILQGIESILIGMFLVPEETPEVPADELLP